MNSGFLRKVLVPFILAMSALCFPADHGRAQLLNTSFQAGIVAADGKYAFSSDNYLMESASEVSRLGAPAIFIYLTPSFRAYYPDNGAPVWPSTNPTSLTELAQTVPYQALFNLPFKTYVITAYSFANSTVEGTTVLDNISLIASSAARQEAETKEFRDLASYLYSTYAGTGKTFILKHWEGDGIVSTDTGIPLGGKYPSSFFAKMVIWEKTRQAGVSQARAAAGNPSGVGVFNAVEVSRVLDYVNKGYNRVINAVVPKVHADMVTYSSYDSSLYGSNAAETATAMNKALNAIKRLAPDPLSLGNKRILISEYGLFENLMPTDTPWRSQAILSTAKSAGLLGAFYWALYDNECTQADGSYFPVAVGIASPLRPTNSQCEGLWMIRPDGTLSSNLSVLEQYWNQN